MNETRNSTLEVEDAVTSEARISKEIQTATSKFAGSKFRSPENLFAYFSNEFLF